MFSNSGYLSYIGFNFGSHAVVNGFIEFLNRPVYNGFSQVEIGRNYCR